MNLNSESSDLWTKSCPCYLGSIWQMWISEESFPNLRTFWPNLRPLLRKFTTKDESPKNLLSKRRIFGPVLLRLLTKYTTTHVRTQERQYQSDSEQPLFHLAYRLCSMKDQRQLTFFRSTIRLNDHHNDLLRCKPQQCLKPLQIRQGQQVLHSSLVRRFDKWRNHNSTKSTWGLQMDQFACFLGIKTSNAGLLTGQSNVMMDWSGWSIRTNLPMVLIKLAKNKYYDLGAFLTQQFLCRMLVAW